MSKLSKKTMVAITALQSRRYQIASDVRNIHFRYWLRDKIPADELRKSYQMIREILKINEELK